jgi:hypothetical protein
MLTPCRILRPFNFSEDGINAQPAIVGETANIPAALVPGLVAGGFVASSAGIETKIIVAAPETGAAVNLDDDSLGLTIRELHADLEAMGIEFDPADDQAALQAQRDAGRAARDAALSEPLTGDGSGEALAPIEDAYPHLSPAQEAALDGDKDGKPGGSRKGERKAKA